LKRKKRLEKILSQEEQCWPVIMSTKISSTSSNNSSGESSPHDIQYFVNTISNLNLSTILGNKPSAQGDNEANNGGDNNQKLKSSFAQVAASFVPNKSKFKTIKIFVASNKNGSCQTKIWKFFCCVN
jgi:hypothetical protein